MAAVRCWTVVFTAHRSPPTSLTLTGVVMEVKLTASSVFLSKYLMALHHHQRHDVH